MRGEISGDMRVQRTLERIHGAFRRLVEERSYDELTVSALCAEARIGRKTFYTYYDSLDDLLKETVGRMTAAYAGRIRHCRPPDDIEEINRQFYLFSLEHGRFYDNLVCSESYQAIGGELLMRLVRDTWHASTWFRSLDPDEQDMLLCFIYHSGAGMYRQWVLSGKRMPLDRVIDLSGRLLGQGLEGLRMLVSQKRKGTS